MMVSGCIGSCAKHILIDRHENNLIITHA